MACKSDSQCGAGNWRGVASASGRAATQNRVQNFQMEPAEPLLAVLKEALSTARMTSATSIGGRGIYCASVQSTFAMCCHLEFSSLADARAVTKRAFSTAGEVNDFQSPIDKRLPRVAVSSIIDWPDRPG